MISNEELGAIVKKIRKERNITQKELANGICCQTTISYLEKGKVFPSIDIMYYIAARLGVTIDYFFRTLEEEQNIYTNSTVAMIEKLTKEKRYEEVYELTAAERKNMKYTIFPHKYIQYIHWQYWRSAQYIGVVSWEKCVEELNNLTNHQKKEIPKFQDLRIKNVLANVLAENKQHEKAKQIYQELLQYDVDTQEYNKLKLKVFYNLTRLYVEDEEYHLAVETAQQGIHYSKKVEDMSAVGNLLFQIALCYFQLNEDKARTKQYFEQAKFFYEFLDHSIHVKYVETYLAHLEN